MHTRSFGILLSAIAAGLWACAEDPVQQSVAHKSQHLIQDGSNGGDLAFYFDPPIRNSPRPVASCSASYVSLAQRLTLRIYVLPSMQPIRSFGPGSGLQVTLTDCTQKVHVNWDTRADDLSPSTVYRARLELTERPAAEPRVLGVADLLIVANQGQGRRAGSEEYFSLVDGRTLPIKGEIVPPRLDLDSDGVFDFVDNCPDNANPSQLDSDHDGKGDACECVGKVCDNPSPGECQGASACDPKTGACYFPASPDGTPCAADGNACTKDVCSGGACVHTKALTFPTISPPVAGACPEPGPAQSLPLLLAPPHDLSKVRTDAAGNLYLVGNYSVPITGAFSIPGVFGYGSSYLVKVSPDGRVLWTRSWGADGAQVGDVRLSISPDGSAVYVGGVISNGEMAGDIVLPAVETSGTDPYHGYLAKFGTDCGQLEWAHLIRHGNVQSVAAHPAGGVIIVGYYKQDVCGAITLDDPTPPVEEYGAMVHKDKNSYVARFDAAGVRLWAKAAKSSTNEVFGTDFQGVAVDPDGRVLVTGTLNVGGSAGDITIPALAGAANGAGLVARLDADGSLEWYRRFAGSLPAYPRTVATDASGKVFIAGHTFSTVTVGDLAIPTFSGQLDAFVAAFEPGGSFAWVKRLGSTRVDTFIDLGIGPDGHPVAAGLLQPQYSSDPPPGQIHRFDKMSGTLLGSFLAVAGIEAAPTVAFSPSGSLYTTGTIYDLTMLPELGLFGPTSYVLRLP